MAQYNPIPQPTNDPNQLRLSVQALKEAFEILTGQRGDGSAAAALKTDIPASTDTTPAPTVAAVQYDVAQTLTSGEQAQARTNINAAEAGSAHTQVSPGNVSTTSTSGKMQGLGSTITITPATTGRVKIDLYGSGAVTVATASFSVELRYGTGTAPADEASPTGTAATSITGWSAVANSVTPFVVGSIITGLTPGTPYWVDVKLTTSTGTATLSGLSCSIVEF